MCRPKDVCEKFILLDDAAIIENWAQNKSVSISFRPAGSATLKCLARGAGAKPHSILDKSIKIKTAKKLSDDDIKRNEAIVDFFNGFSLDNRDAAKKLLMGLVGHWITVGEKYKVDGIYLTTLGGKSFSKESIAKDKEMSYLKLDSPGEKNELILFFKSLFNDSDEANEGIEKLNELVNITEQKVGTDNKQKAPVQYYLFTRLFFSGDYDAHDLLGDGEIIVTKQDSEYLNPLQSILMTGRKEQLKRLFGDDVENYFDKETVGAQELQNESLYIPKGIKEETLKAQFGDRILNCFGRETPGDYCRIQHGPQFNYTAQMANENLAIILKAIKNKNHDLDGLNTLANGVMKMDLPVAMCNGLVKGNVNWSILDGPEALRDFYDKLGLKIKSTWRDQDGRDERIIHLFGTVIHYIFGAKGLRREFDTNKEKREKVEKILSGYKIMYDNKKDEEENHKTKYVNCLEKALDKAF